MKEIKVMMSEFGEKYLVCSVCEKSVTVVEKSSGACEDCLYIWAEVTRKMNSKKDGEK